MICRDFPLLYSAQLDGHAAEHDQLALQRHLRECAMCRRSAAEMRRLRADLRALPAPPTNPELTGLIQKRLRLEASLRAEAMAQARLPQKAVLITGAGINWVEFRKFWFNSFANWMDGRRSKIFSQTVGAIVSLLLFFVVVTRVFTQAHAQAYRTLTLAAQTIFEDPNDEVLRHQAILKTYLFSTPPPPPLLYSDPELQGVVAALREEDVIFTAEISKDGASTIFFVQPPNDPSVQAKLSTAMAQAGTFLNDDTRNRNTSTVAVVYLSSITTTARL